MKWFNKIWSKIAQKNPKTYLFGARRQANQKAESLSGSVVDKRTPIYKPFSLLLPTIIIIIAFTVVPFILNIQNAFEVKNLDGTSRWGFDNYKTLIQQPIFAVGFRNSVMYGLIVLPFNIVLALVISSLIAATYRKFARGVWQTIFFLPYITNIVAVSLAFIQFFDVNGMFNKGLNIKSAWLTGTPEGSLSFRPLLPILVLGIWSSLAFNVLMFTTAMLSVDKNLYKSASIDGIGGIKQFFKITLPSVKPMTNFLVTLGIINGIKVFPLALFNNNPQSANINGASTLMLYIYDKTKANDYQLASASSIVLFGIGIVYTILFRGGFKALKKANYNLGEYNVWKEIKNSKVMIEYQAKKK